MKTFDVDDKMAQTLDSLREKFNLKDRADVIKKSVFLLAVASDHLHKDGHIHLMRPDGRLLIIEVD